MAGMLRRCMSNVCDYSSTPAASGSVSPNSRRNSLSGTSHHLWQPTDSVQLSGKIGCFGRRIGRATAQSSATPDAADVRQRSYRYPFCDPE